MHFTILESYAPVLFFMFYFKHDGSHYCDVCGSVEMMLIYNIWVQSSYLLPRSASFFLSGTRHGLVYTLINVHVIKNVCM